MRLFDYLYYKLFNLSNSLQNRHNDAITPLFLLIIPFWLWFLPVFFLVFEGAFYPASIPVIWGLMMLPLGWIGYWRYVLKSKYRLINSKFQGEKGWKSTLGNALTIAYLLAPLTLLFVHMN